MSENNNSSGGIGVASILAIVFVVLKLTGTIDWSWWWVLSPVWMSFAIVILVSALVSIFR